MICYNCKRAIPDGSSACPYCGAHTSADDDPYEVGLRNPYSETGFYRDTHGTLAVDAYQDQDGALQRQISSPGPVTESSGDSAAQTAGVLGLVLCMLHFTLLPIILCTIGLVKAGNACARNGGRYSPSAKVGRVCGAIGLVFSLLRLIAVLLAIVIGILAVGSLSKLLEDLPYMAQDFFENLLLLMPMIL